MGPLETKVKQSTKAGLYYGLGSAGRGAFLSIVFILCMDILVYRLELDPDSVFKGMIMFIFTFQGLGSQAANIPSIGKAKAAAVPVFSIIDEPSALDTRKPKGKKLRKIEQGKVELINCNFKYPTRQQKVMDDFNLTIPAGAKIALVGHSGCGKSTLTNILLRFYNLDSGKLLIDGTDLEDYDVLALRDQCGVVMQEPLLFNTSIKNNILFGNPDATDA